MQKRTIFYVCKQVNECEKSVSKTIVFGTFSYMPENIAF